MVAEHTPAPDFSLPADDGSTLSLKSLRGKSVVLYFYPKDDTPGCTTESCEFRDAFPRFGQKNAVILGISADSPESHVKFKNKYQLPFALLSDEDHSVSTAYGVWKEKSMYGKKFMGIERTTFIIDPQGNIAKIFYKVKSAGHAAEVEAALKDIG